MQIEHSEFQDQLVRGLAHRMNNILTLFHGYLGLLMDNQKLDKETREGLAKIKEGARAASEIVRNAIEATFEGGTVKIVVSSTKKPPGTPAKQALQWISIAVTDNGP